MKAKKFQNAFDYKVPEGEINNEPSLTVPNMTMSLEEILTRYTRGGEIATLTPVYQEHDEFDESPDLQKMDAVEKLQYAKDIRDSIAEFQSQKKVHTEPKPEPKPEPKEEQSDEP